jgi:hypothetical protein
MAHFAKVVDGIVTQVIVAEPEFFDTFIDTSAGEWVQTSYNTYGGVHILGGTPLRKNFAGIGFTYDKSLDAFIPPKPYPSWVLNEESCLYEPPITKPENPDENNSYIWNETEFNNSGNGWVLNY